MTPPTPRAGARLACAILLGLSLGACAAGHTTPSRRSDAGRGDGATPPPAPDAAPPDGALPDGGPVDDPCLGVSCPIGRSCTDGVCVLEGSCAGVTCPPTETCVPGPGCVPLEVDGDGDGVSVGDGDCDDGDPDVRPMAPERCNAIDDDCDGMIDEGNPGGGRACSTGMAGACAGGEEQCIGGRIQCTAGTGPTAESCNGLDDDCDGATDEDDPGGGAMCSTGMGGPCAAGTQRCTGGRLQCEPNRPPEPESCNGVDDDCDGRVDNGASVDVIETSFAELSGYHDGCAGFASGVDSCEAAVHRLCAARSACAPTGGVGPFDPGTGRPSVACISGGVGLHVTFAELSGAQPPCDGDAAAGLDVCWSAAHRLCQMRGHRTGFGPIEHSASGADIVCLDRGELLDVPYGTLSGFQPSCTEGNAVSLPCHTAIHRFCTGRMGGGGTGFGAVEHSAGTAYVACVAP